ncbi:MAG: DUF192 domain-containing protein [Treponema sp.]|jgi:uncharacterized membrane protein (UPF0127 family)|nr:DUF192 domain-containing protein [Treponema sp.]
MNFRGRYNNKGRYLPPVFQTAPGGGAKKKPAGRLAGHFGVFLLFLVLVSPLSCGPQFTRKELTIHRAGGEPVRITVELARTDAERAQGLMYRKSLDDGKGMLFIFDRDQIMSFWMKNTRIPLSIAFITKDGRIFEIRDMQPLAEYSVRSSRSARYALEAPQGWFNRVGIKPGDVLVLDAGIQ